MKTKALYNAKEFKNIKEIIYNSAKNYRGNTAFVIKKKDNNKTKYINISYKRFLDDVNDFGTELFSMHMKGKRIAIIGRNRYEWMLGYITALLGGIVVIPLDKDLQYDELESSLIRSKADAIIFDSKLEDTIKQIKKNKNTELREFICMDKIEGYKDVQTLINNGSQKLKKGFISYTNYSIDENEMNILLFTSGTTAQSKAVMLSHKNIASNIYALQCVEDIRPTDTNIAFLPFHHIFGSTCMILTLACGVKNVFPDGLRYIKQNLCEYKVTMFVGVPILIESIYKAIEKEIEKQGKAKMVRIATKISRFLMKFHIDIRRKIFKQILDALGGELRLLVSGGAAADPKYSRAFTDLGVNIVQGYGLTETSPVICAEDAKHIKFGSVGIPMINDQVEIDEPDDEGIGEIKVKGPNVMLGYYEMEEQTNDVLKDGWFYTGDLGYIDKHGFLRITGRIKSMIVLKNGKKVFPEEVETIINRLELVKECMVFGMPSENDKNDVKLSVKIVYDEEVVSEKYPTKKEDELNEIIWEQIKEINKSFPRYKHIQNMILTKKELIKTTTKKIKRPEEMKRIIKAMTD